MSIFGKRSEKLSSSGKRVIVLSLIITIFSMILLYGMIVLFIIFQVDMIGVSELNLPSASPFVSSMLILSHFFMILACNSIFLYKMEKSLKNISYYQKHHLISIKSFVRWKKYYEMSFIPLNVAVGAFIATMIPILQGLIDVQVIFGIFFKALGFAAIIFAISFVLAELLITRTYIPNVVLHRQILASNITSWESSLTVWQKLMIIGATNVFGFAVLFSYEKITQEHLISQSIAMTAFVSIAYATFFLFYKSNSDKFMTILHELQKMITESTVVLNTKLPLVSTDDLATLTLIHETLMQNIAMMVRQLDRASEMLGANTSEFREAYQELRHMALDVSKSVESLTKSTQDISQLTSDTHEKIVKLEQRLAEMERNEDELNQNLTEATQMIRILTFNITLEASRMSSSDAGGFIALTKEIEKFSSTIREIYDDFTKNSGLFKEHILTTVNQLVSISNTISTDASNIVSQSEEIMAIMEETISGIEELENRLNELVAMSQNMKELTKRYVS